MEKVRTGQINRNNSNKLATKINRGELVTCPCCKQTAKIYKRSISGTMVRQLIKIYNKGGKDKWIHITELSSHGGDFAKLEHWAMVKRAKNRSDAKKDSGFWKITPHGINFLKGKATAQKYVFFYNKETLGVSDERIKVEDAVKNQFNFKKLMRAGL